MKTPRFSVIIPALNEEKFLPKLLNSLAGQTMKDFEVIVVDGKSTDKTVAVAKSFAKDLPFLKVIVSPRANLPLQRNVGVKEARGEWLVFVDADSVLLPHLLKRVHFFIQTQKPKLFTTWFRPDSEESGDALTILLGNMIIEGALLLKRPVAPGPLTIVRSDTFALVGGYDEARQWGEDYDLTKRIYRKGVPLAMLRETLYIYSLRRLRNQGTLKVVQMFSRAAFSVLLTNQAPRYIAGYDMGGHPYEKKQKSVKRSVVKQFEKQLKKLMKEFFE